MQALGPKMKELKERYKDNPQQMGQAQMKLFREEGVNPLAGCLPMLIQMPVWFALYSVLLSAAPLYQADFLFIDDVISAFLIAPIFTQEITGKHFIVARGESVSMRTVVHMIKEVT